MVSEIEANIDTKVVRPSFANLGMCGAYLRYFLPRYFGTGFPLSHLRSRLINIPRGQAVA